MSEQAMNEAREAAIAQYLHAHSSEDGQNADYHLCDQCGSHEVAFRAGYEAATTNHAAEIERLRAALDNLVVAVTEASNDMAGMFTIAHFHGMPYTGRQYGEELKAAQAALAGTPEGSGNPATGDATPSRGDTN